MSDIEITPITIKELTTGAANGTGAFDKIMSTIQARLDIEYNGNKIKGTDYSKVYLGSIEASMQQAIVFLLGKDKAANEAALIEAQILLAETQRDKVLQEIKLLELQEPKIQAEVRAIEAGILKTTEETLLVTAQTAKVGEETTAVIQGVLNAKEELKKTTVSITLLERQVDKTTSETTLIDQKKLNAVTERDVLSATVNKINTEIANIAQNTKTSKAQESTELAKTLDIVNGVPVTGLVGAQKAKVDADTNLAIQRKKTEMSNILDTVDGSSIAGINGKKMSLYQQQGDGFTRDAEQKLTKIMTDTWSVRASTNENTDTRFTNLDNESIGEVVNKAKAGIGT